MMPAPSSSKNSTKEPKEGTVKVKKQNQAKWENRNPPFPDRYSRFFVQGPSDTGKTKKCGQIIRHLFKSKKELKQLIIISPNYDLDDQLSGEQEGIAPWAAKQGKIVKVYKGFPDRKAMGAFVDYMKKCAADGIESVVYVDDPIGIGQFTGNVNSRSPWNSFVTGCKFHKAYVVFSTQCEGGLSKTARSNVDVFVFLPDRLHRHEIWQSCPFVTEAQFNRIMDTYVNQKYRALWVNVKFGELGVYFMDEKGQISAISSVPR